VCKVPERFLTEGRHRLEIQRSEAPPPHPTVLDSVGLRLLSSRLDAGALRLDLAGPGRALGRFHAASRPVVVDGGRELACRWDEGTGVGWVEVCRGPEAVEVLLRAGC
jgi:hypothetical protein